MPEIKIENLTVRYGDKKKGATVPFEKLNAVFPDGQISVVIGESGCGKTSLLRCIAGLLPYEGDILFDGADALSIPHEQRRIAYVSQNYVLYPHWTVFENIAYPLRIIGCSKEETVKRVNEIACQLGIESCLSRKPKYLSGGQQQRVALARAMVKDPALCLFDEPLSNVDSPQRSHERLFLRQVIRESGATAIYVTHNIHEAMAMGDRIYLFAEGSFLLQGPPESFAFSSDPRVRAFLEAGDRLE